jgi:uncharacterized membrane protein YfcA
LGPAEIALIFLITAVSSMLQAAVGLGMALLSLPLLLMLDPAFVPAPVILAVLYLAVLMATRERKQIETTSVRLLVVGFVPGSAVGAWVLSVWSGSLDTLIAGIILLAVVMSVVGPEIRPRPGGLAAAGVVSGIMGTVSSIGGPPVALLLQHMDGNRLRATLSGYFIFSSSISLVALWATGHFDFERLKLAFLLLPGCTVGFLLSRRLRTWVDGGYVRPLILILATLSALAIIIRNL